VPAHVTLSSAFADWETPSWFVDLVHEVGPIVLDPATSARNPTRALTGYLPPAHPFDTSLCGLTGPWPGEGLVFVNPRYGAFLRGPVSPRRPVFKDGVLVGFGTGWVRRICQHQGEGLVLVPARPDTEWWRELHAWADWVLLWASSTRGSRVHFIDPRIGKVAHGSNMPSSVFYRGPRVQRFCEVFEPHGTLVPGRDTLERLLRLHCEQP